MRILFFGDIVGKIGRKALAVAVPLLSQEYAPDAIIANGENMAHGQKITQPTMAEILHTGIHLITSGDHHKKKDEISDLNTAFPGKMLRAANYPPGVPGTGIGVLSLNGTELLVINLMGRVFMKPMLECPFRTLDAILATHASARHILVDFHAEATSEKTALGWYADGRVSALLGTHTHVPTADAKILPQGTAFVSDIGMVGPRDSVIGADKATIIENFLTQLAMPHDIPEHGVAQINAVCVDLDDATGRARSITRVDREVEI